MQPCHIFPDLEPVCCSMSSSNCCFLTCIQVSQEPGQAVWYSHLFQNFPQFIVIHTVKGFDIVNKAEIDVFLELSCFFDDPADVGNLISGSSSFSNPAWTSGSSQFTYRWSLTWENFEQYFTCMWDWVQLCSSLNILWHCLSLGLEWKLTFFSTVATAEFSKFAGILSAALSQHHLLGFETVQLNSISSTSLVCSDASEGPLHFTSHSRMSGSRWVITPSNSKQYDYDILKKILLH